MPLLTTLQGQAIRSWDDDDPLVARYIEPHPHKPGVSDARVTGYGYSVWILVDALRASDNNIARVAEEYQLPEEAVRAVVAFYQNHQRQIDARIDDNAAFFGALT